MSDVGLPHEAGSRRGQLALPAGLTASALFLGIDYAILFTCLYAPLCIGLLRRRQTRHAGGDDASRVFLSKDLPRAALGLLALLIVFDLLGGGGVVHGQARETFGLPAVATKPLVGLFLEQQSRLRIAAEAYPAFLLWAVATAGSVALAFWSLTGLRPRPPSQDGSVGAGRASNLSWLGAAFLCLPLLGLATGMGAAFFGRAWMFWLWGLGLLVPLFLPSLATAGPRAVAWYWRGMALCGLSAALAWVLLPGA
ncbi:MAG: hypothetical protein MI824_24095 [Hyphomicrobiales bacterium]|nr:hypothetical protein [Hyphomicrobiales bacterium]